MNIQKIKLKPELERDLKLSLFERLGIWDAWDLFPFLNKYVIREKYYKLKSFFIPQHKKIRAAIPRTWTDLVDTIREVNFAMVVEFYEDEYLDGYTDWSATEEHKEFERWLIMAYDYIKIKRPAIEKEYWNSFPDLSNGAEGKSYKELYGETNRLEKEVTDKDTELLVQIVSRRGMFWT
jgi:hypothetical protein